jgi:DNA-directed RNA polymerase subunit RPC12/RpoP
MGMVSVINYSSDLWRWVMAVNRLVVCFNCLEKWETNMKDGKVRCPKCGYRCVYDWEVRDAEKEEDHG